MKVLLLILGSSLALGGSLSGQTLQIRPRLGEWGDPSGFPPIHIISAEQLPFHTLEVQATQSAIESQPDGAIWQSIAAYGCWFEDQFDIATFPNYGYDWLPPYAWFRSINRPCDLGDFAPAESPQFNYFPNLTKWESSWRARNSKGIVMKIGVEVLPAPGNGVRRFIGVPE